MPSCCTLSIIIPTHNRSAQLNACLENLTALNLTAYGIEIIVVSDGQDPQNDAVARRFEPFSELRFCSQPHAGPSSARNRGARLARGRHLAFLDDDCGLAPDWPEHVSSAIRKFPEAMLGGTTVNGLPANPYATASQLLVDYLYDCHDKAAGLRFFTGNNMIIPVDSFRRIGGFNVKFPLAGGEDRDICMRWQASGGELIHIPALTVIHYRRMNLAGFWRQHYNYGLSALRCHVSRSNAESWVLPRLESMRFYLQMLAYPGKKRLPAVSLSQLRALISLSQLAYDAGVGSALVRHHRNIQRR